MVMPFRGDGADHLENLLHHDRRQAHRRLVEQQQLGPAHQGAADGQHLLLAAGKRAGQLAGALLSGAGNSHRCVSRSAGDFGLVVAHEGAHRQVFGDGQAREDAAPFRHQRDALADDVVRRKR
jgi:hypothetical protein